MTPPRLSRPGVWRLAFAMPAEAFAARFGGMAARPPKGRMVALPGWDLTRLDELTPHPVYAWMGWVQILLARRAGIDISIFSSPTGWYVGHHDRTAMALLALGGAALDIAPPGVRRHCAHEIAFAVLCGLQYSLCRTGQHDVAAHVAALREHLPVARLCR